MAVIWIIFGYSAIITKKEKWPADIGTRARDPRFTCFLSIFSQEESDRELEPVQILRGQEVDKLKLYNHR